jgi:hypothetical protein
MLLRRVMRHVKAQDWFAVGVDFFIVVLGVFVGLQVQDWNDSRKDRIEEHALLARLHDEVQSLIEANGMDLAELRTRGEDLMSANAVLFNVGPDRSLTPLECRQIAGSHAYRLPPDELPVLDELLETGRFDILRNSDLKAKLRDYIRLRGRAQSYFAEATNELFRLHSRYPELVRVVRVPESQAALPWGGLSGPGYTWMPQCDVPGMRANTAFRNEYADNLSRINSLTRLTAQRQEKLLEIERLLAERL